MKELVEKLASSMKNLISNGEDLKDGIKLNYNKKLIYEYLYRTYL